jgi:hypothetical protein
MARFTSVLPRSPRLSLGQHRPRGGGGGRANRFFMADARFAAMFMTMKGDPTAYTANSTCE